MLCIPASAFKLTCAPPGSPVEHVSRGGVYLPPVISRTKGRRGTCEAAIESSYQDDSNQYLQFYLKGHVQD